MMDSVPDFLELTGTSSSEEALMWLAAANDDFEVAVNMYFNASSGSGASLASEVTSSLAATKATDNQEIDYPVSAGSGSGYEPRAPGLFV